MLNVQWSLNHKFLFTISLTPGEYQTTYMAGYKFNKEATSHMLDVTNWADKNTWVCKADTCNLVLPSRVKLVLHIRRSHTMTALEYFRKHKDSLITEVQHTCQVIRLQN